MSFEHKKGVAVTAGLLTALLGLSACSGSGNETLGTPTSSLDVQRDNQQQIQDAITDAESLGFNVIGGKYVPGSSTPMHVVVTFPNICEQPVDHEFALGYRDVDTDRLALMSLSETPPVFLYGPSDATKDLC